MYTNILQERSNIGRVRYREVSSRGQWELGPKNDVHCREMSTIKFPLYGGFVMRV